MADQDYEIVLVVWEDSRGADSEWCWLKDLKSDTAFCTSVGRLIENSDERVVIAPHWSVDSDGDLQFCGTMRIPKRAVQTVWRIAKADLMEKGT